MSLMVFKSESLQQLFVVEDSFSSWLWIAGLLQNSSINLRWLQTHQHTIRAELYQGLADALQNDDLSTTNQLGHHIVLPSSFTGSDHHMSQLYQDSMAIA